MKLYHIPPAFHSAYANGYGWSFNGSLKFSIFSFKSSKFSQLAIFCSQGLFST
ncbi:MAG: hypothetical protein LBC61_02535 [Candidatus Peribacteria bacterium]|nr:hypothetical protein [Candidatus Peribacteria bacterium]